MFHKLCLILILNMLAISSVSAEEVKKDRLVIGVTPWNEQSKIRLMLQPLIAYLNQQLGVETVLNIAADYKELSDRILEKAVDVGFFSPNAYVEANQKIKGLQYIITVQNKSESGEVRDHYFGVIVSVKNRPVKTLADIKGKRFGFTDLKSTSGYLYPRALLIKNGFDPEKDFSQVFMLKKHDKLLDALVADAIDAGGTNDIDLQRAVAKNGDIFQILAKTQPIPFDAYAAGPHVPQKMTKKLKEVFLKIISDNKILTEMQSNGYPYAGFTERGNEFYDVIREVNALNAAK